MTATNGATIFGCAGPELGADEAAFFRDADPWGFILFARNVESPDQLRRLTDGLRASVGRDAPVFVDQEGGRVQRLRAPHWREWLPPLEMVRLATAGAPSGHARIVAERAVWLRYRIIASELRAVGIDGNCAPCLDVATGATHEFLKNRCLSDDPARVARLGRAAANGLLSGGVLPVVKHMPGHGRATLDTHKALPTVSEGAEVLASTDFAPFAALSDMPLAMTAHIVFSAFDARPATQSPEVVRLIRDRIGFAGVLMTDDLNMEALSGSLAQRTAASLAAGCDIALHCKGDLGQMIEVAAAAGRLDTATQARADAALGWRREPEYADIVQLESELTGLLDGQGHV
ncbi:beta-N-acetylhexosaminidase [Aliigemmobacter aestuarii]|uniref:beta-N-acetylhexosaminidase n=1 Tax=Aliigemmobacter aestuarii TaxID=1445661 RepID=A0A4S3MLP2_9RHOB|nr:beta-N-acetylhexosaminidase [Gemmobacter aestuarii]THD83148.1 beta-N-acetylhexosaminidase [Gemmobacter aestuarii]